jgi:acetyl-CoA carboxylase carboxyltransferase component
MTARVEVIDDRRVMRIDVAGSGPKDRLTIADGNLLAEGARQGLEQRIPLFITLSCMGPTVDEGLGTSNAWAKAAAILASASGVVPIFLGAAGPVTSGPSLLLGLADIVIFTEQAFAFVSGPMMIEEFTGVPVSSEDLGGAGSSSRTSGVAHMVVADVEGVIEAMRMLLDYLPDNVDQTTPRIFTTDPIDRPTPHAGVIVPDHRTGSYDVREVVREIADDGEFVELRAGFAPNMVVGFASFGGIAVGVVANQSQALAGAIDIPASHKGAQFVGMCDSLNVPLLTLVDTSGFLPGKDLEWRGMIRHGAQLAFSYARATVPRVGLILRKSYGGAYIVMDSRFMGNDVMLAWPTAEVAVMGAKGAVEILHRNASPDERQDLVADYENKYLSPYPAAERGAISAVIDPADTRRIVAQNLDLLASKREKHRFRRHDNMPL